MCKEARKHNPQWGEYSTHRNWPRLIKLLELEAKMLKHVLVLFQMFKKLSGDMEDIKKDLNQTSWVENYSVCVDDIMDRINSRLDIAGEEVSELEDISIEGILPSLFFESNITLLWKPDKNITRKENYRPISVRNIDATIIHIFDN